MIKLIVYTDGKPDAVRALHFAAEFKKRLNAELSVITVRSSTHAAEEPPPVGAKLTADQLAELRHGGLRTLLDAASVLVDEGVLAPIDSIQIRDIPRGHVFVCNGAADDRIVFYECFGPFVEAINKEVDEHGYGLLIAALPRRGRLVRLMIGSTARKLALDLHTSLLVVRGGGPDHRFLVCADGSPSSQRQFPMLQQLLPAIRQPIDILCLSSPDMPPQKIKDAEACMQRARDWLTVRRKLGLVALRESHNRSETILEIAGENAVIMMGSSLRHDVYRRIRGSLPLRILESTPSSVLLVKRVPEGDPDFMTAPYSCG
ncbi:MAG: universal stress protein [Deltaproteobacteria bacterium]|nr:universal stress protein [Deltaproteobacteria bacterium]